MPPSAQAQQYLTRDFGSMALCHGTVTARLLGDVRAAGYSTAQNDPSFTAFTFRESAKKPGVLAGIIRNPSRAGCGTAARSAPARGRWPAKGAEAATLRLGLLARFQVPAAFRHVGRAGRTAPSESAPAPAVAGRLAPQRGPLAGLKT